MFCDVVFTLTVLSSEAVNSDCPSLAKSTHRTEAVWALNTVDSPLLCVCLVCAWRKRRGGGGGKRGGEIYTSVDLSYNFHHDDDAHVECKGIKGSRWVCSSCVQTHTLGIHSRTVLSRDAEATRCPDGEKATDNMASYREVKAVKILRIECNRRWVEKSNDQKRLGKTRVQKTENFLPCVRQIDMLWSVV